MSVVLMSVIIIWLLIIDKLSKHKAGDISVQLIQWKVCIIHCRSSLCHSCNHATAGGEGNLVPWDSPKLSFWDTVNKPRNRVYTGTLFPTLFTSAPSATLLQHCLLLHPLLPFFNTTHLWIHNHTLPALLTSELLDTFLQHRSSLHPLQPSKNTA